jgi:predicted Zn-ribbon and HTH transcriptional regulator
MINQQTETYKYSYDQQVIMIIELRKCNRCDHEWLPRMEKIPVECPKCKSTYWNKERTYKKKGSPE